MNVKHLSTLSVILITSLLFTGCSWNLFGPDIQEVKTIKKAVEKTPLNIQGPKPLKLKNVKWTIITPENAEKVFEELEKSNTDKVLYGLTDDGYQDLSKNFVKIRKHIFQQQMIIGVYKDYYEKPKETETINSNVSK